MFFFDPTFVLLIPALILAFWAQYKVKSTYAKYARVPSLAGRSGQQVAETLLSVNGLSNVQVEPVPGHLSDHYDPTSRKLRLSEDVYHGNSVAAISVAAHEVGHAIQHGNGYQPLMLRAGLVPVANIGSSLAMPLFFAGFLFAWRPIMDLGILLFSGALLFHLVTLPVEFNASNRALAQLANGGILPSTEIGDAKKVLRAAALTYVAATTVTAIHLLRLILLRNSRD